MSLFNTDLVFSWHKQPSRTEDLTGSTLVNNALDSTNRKLESVKQHTADRASMRIVQNFLTVVKTFLEHGKVQLSIAIDQTLDQETKFRLCNKVQLKEAYTVLTLMMSHLLQLKSTFGQQEEGNVSLQSLSEWEKLESVDKFQESAVQLLASLKLTLKATSARDMGKDSAVWIKESEVDFKQSGNNICLGVSRADKLGTNCRSFLVFLDKLLRKL